jgi:hypothetical protein
VIAAGMGVAMTGVIRTSGTTGEKELYVYNHHRCGPVAA